jgi:hypothetical protein
MELLRASLAAQRKWTMQMVRFGLFASRAAARRILFVLDFLVSLSKLANKGQFK